eukprot:Sdes_comp19439_c0_seq1m10825
MAYRNKVSRMIEVPCNIASFSVSSSGIFSDGNVNISNKGISFARDALHFPADSQSSPLLLDPLIEPSSASSCSPTTSDKWSPSGCVEVKLEDLRFEEIIGRGSGGIVQRALHVPTGLNYAVKVMPLDVNEKVSKQILFELRTLYEAQSPYVVGFHGAFFNEGTISVVLEYMDRGPLSGYLSKGGTFNEPLIATLSAQILSGLVYLHKHRHLIHRDIKPSNILINSKGQVKISDFGVSGQLTNTISSCVSWVGTVTYMSPERIQGKSYSTKSDIWSFGLTMMELAIGCFPYSFVGTTQKICTANLGFWELLDCIVDQPVPELPAGKYSREFCDFIAACLQKEPQKRHSASELLRHPFVSKYSPVDLSSLVFQEN